MILTTHGVRAVNLTFLRSLLRAFRGGENGRRPIRPDPNIIIIMKESIIDLRLNELPQLFNSLDATPFPETDLDADAEEFLMSWALEMHADTNIRIKIHLKKPPTLDILTAQGQTETAVHNFFEYRADVVRRRLHRLLARGRTSLLIGVSSLTLTLLAANLVDKYANENDEDGGASPFWGVLRESLVIGGWVSMWGPLNILLYEWWPIRQERMVCLRLAQAKVDIVDLSSRNLPT